MIWLLIIATTIICSGSQRLLFANNDLKEVFSGQAILILEFPFRVPFIALSQGPFVRVWRLSISSSYEILQTVQIQTGNVTATSFSADYKYLNIQSRTNIEIYKFSDQRFSLLQILSVPWPLSHGKIKKSLSSLPIVMNGVAFFVNRQEDNSKAVLQQLGLFETVRMCSDFDELIATTKSGLSAWFWDDKYKWGSRIAGGTGVFDVTENCSFVAFSVRNSLEVRVWARTSRANYRQVANFSAKEPIEQLKVTENAKVGVIYRSSRWEQWQIELPVGECPGNSIQMNGVCLKNCTYQYFTTSSIGTANGSCFCQPNYQWNMLADNCCPAGDNPSPNWESCLCFNSFELQNGTCLPICSGINHATIRVGSTCLCDSGYYWNNSLCVINCSQFTHTLGNGGLSACSCADGYQWDSQSCMKLSQSHSRIGGPVGGVVAIVSVLVLTVVACRYFRRKSPRQPVAPSPIPQPLLPQPQIGPIQSQLDRVEPYVEPMIRPETVQPEIQPYVQPNVQPSSVQPENQVSIQADVQPSVQPSFQHYIQPYVQPYVPPYAEPYVESNVNPPIQMHVQPSNDPVEQGVGSLRERMEIEQSLEILDGMRTPGFIDEPTSEVICSICLEDKPNVVTNCHHWYHENCISDWLDHEDNCPCCREPNVTYAPPPP